MPNLEVTVFCEQCAETDTFDNTYGLYGFVAEHAGHNVRVEARFVIKSLPLMPTTPDTTT